MGAWRASAVGAEDALMADQFTARKLWCLDQAVRDPAVSNLEFRALYYLASCLDRSTGEARVRQQTIADALGATRRGIQLALDHLKALGHLDVVYSPGRSKLNAYRLPLEKAKFSSPLDAENTNPSSPLNPEKAKRGSPIQGRKGELSDNKRRTEKREKANCHSHQYFPCSIPLNLPSRAREASGAEALASLGAELERRLGSDKARAWFSKAEIVDLFGDAVTLALPSTFVRDRIQQDFERELLTSCQTCIPSIRSVRTIVRQAA
jgi:hypothetical protein